MSVMQVNREIAKLAARSGGFFWLPCPLCRQEFGGHEWTDVNGHESSIPTDWKTDEAGVVELETSTGICPDCTAKGLGCKAHIEVGFSPHEGCEHLPERYGRPGR